uniref:Transmembrane protein 88 n=1 Tax=Paramormyrops kingsleyae TaxID=1676925 RepID=A0A3B3R4D8_9TELE|nr:transmembrane protein 88 isoform X1 [Paramormyrops kingsleyae]
MSLSGTLDKHAAPQQGMDLGEDSHSQHTHLHNSNSVASTAPTGNQAGVSGVVVPPPYSAAESGGDAPLELRGALDCWACSVLVTAQNLVIAAINAGLAGLVFGLILTPAIVMVVFGFLCHSTVSCLCASPQRSSYEASSLGSKSPPLCRLNSSS